MNACIQGDTYLEAGLWKRPQVNLDYFNSDQQIYYWIRMYVYLWLSYRRQLW